MEKRCSCIDFSRSRFHSLRFVSILTSPYEPPCLNEEFSHDYIQKHQDVFGWKRGRKKKTMWMFNSQNVSNLILKKVLNRKTD